MAINWLTLAFQALNFLVLVWLLHRLLYRPVRRVIESRREEVAAAFARANAVQAEAEQLRQALEQRLAALEDERKRILDAAHEEIEAQRQAMLTDAREQAQRELAAARRQFEQERREATKALRADLARLAADLAAQILNAQGGDRGAELALAALIEDFSALPEEQQADWHAALAAAGGRLDVVTATDLRDSSKERWLERLRACLGPALEPRFLVDDSLLGGAEWRLPNRTLSRAWRRTLERAMATLAGEGDAEE